MIDETIKKAFDDQLANLDRDIQGLIEYREWLNQPLKSLRIRLSGSKQDNGWLIPVEKMVPSKGQPLHIYEGVKWAEPSVAELRKIMRYAYEHRLENGAKSKNALKTAEKLTWDNTAKKIIEVFEQWTKN